MTRKLSPALLSRIDRLSGCEGRWIVDCRAIEGDYSYALRSLSDSWPLPVTEDGRTVDHHWSLTDAGQASPHKRNSLEDAALYCAHTGWQSRLLFVSDYLREDCSWPGGYSPSAVYRSNARVFRDQFSKELELADGDADDVALDVRYVTDEMLETLESLESYPLLSEDDHSELELELQDEAWQNWAVSDWRRLVCTAIDGYLPEDSAFDGDDLLSRIASEDDKLRALFDQCCEASNTYWEEESDGDQWIDLERVAAELSLEDLREITGVHLKDPAVLEAQARWADQQAWRLEAYPWPGAPAAPLLAGL